LQNVVKRKYKHKGELKRDIAKVKVWCGFTGESVIPLFFLRHPTVTGALVSYLDVLEL
jgi:hypothetical protein